MSTASAKGVILCRFAGPLASSALQMNFKSDNDCPCARS